MAMKTGVYIATTTGPARVLRVIEAPHQRQSTACLNYKVQKLRIATDYNDFVNRDGGVIAAFTGCELYRLDLSHDIEDGDSWQLGAFAAHALFAEARLATAPANDPDCFDGVDLVFLATGEVDSDCRINPVAAVERKLTLAEPLLEKTGQLDLPVLAIMPLANKTVALDGLLEAMRKRHHHFSWRFEKTARFTEKSWSSETANTDDNISTQRRSHGQRTIERAKWLSAAGAVVVGGAVSLAIAAASRNGAEPTAKIRGAPVDVHFLAHFSVNGKCLGRLHPHNAQPEKLTWRKKHTASSDNRICSVDLDFSNTTENTVTIDIRTGADRSIVQHVLPAGDLWRHKAPVYTWRDGERDAIKVTATIDGQLPTVAEIAFSKTTEAAK